MHYIINVMTCIIMNYLIKKDYECFFQCFGGSQVYILLYGCLFYVSLCYKKYHREISILMIICPLMLWYNKVIYYEVHYTHDIENIFCTIYIYYFFFWHFGVGLWLDYLSGIQNSIDL